MFIVFDTETTGLPRDYKAPLSDSDNWPRVVQIAWQLHDENGYLIKNGNLIIKPEDFTIPFNAVKIHGISNEMANDLGMPLKSALEEFNNDLRQAKYLAGHNLEFDLNVIGAEYHRLNLPYLFAGKQVLDTMQSSIDFCKLPGGRGGKFKYPKLEELHEKLFSKKFTEAHNACADVEATSRCFFELCRLNVIKRDDINLAIDVSEILLKDAKKILAAIHKYEPHQEKKSNETNVFDTHILKDNQNTEFSHLHNHSQYSVLQSTTEINALVKRAAEFNCPAVALTDNGNMYASFIFWNAVDKENKNIKAHNEAITKGEKEGKEKKFLKAIIGCELNITTNHLDKSSQNNGNTQVLLAKNKIGYHNLVKLSSIGFVDGFYYVPRIDKNVLLNHKEGLIATTGGLNSEIPNLILNVGEEAAEEAFCWWLDQFGEDFYVELNRHGLEEEDHVNKVLLGFAKKYNVKYFAANNNYYLDKKNARARDILVCVKEGFNAENKGDLEGIKLNSRFKKYFYSNDEYYFKSPQEMSSLFFDLPEALLVTNEIVEKIEVLKLGRDVLLPKFEIPDNFLDKRDLDPTDDGKGTRGENAYLKFLTYEGANYRYKEITSEIKERLDFELSTVERMGFPGYFLIVWDFIFKAREMKVSVGPGRGSAAGSVIAYCLGITNVDPIKYALLFERFLNPDRVSMPDIDIDFDDEGRQKVIDYVVNKYGKNQVAQIITYGKMGGKSALRDTARVLSLELSEADKLAKAFPDAPEATLKKIVTSTGLTPKLREELKDKKDQLYLAEEFEKLSHGDSLQAQVIKNATDLEGSVRNVGIHACGIIITPGELTKYVPVAKAKDSELLCTQFDNSVVESAGLLKMDFLGLRTLTIIKDTLKLIKYTRNIEFDIDEISLEDPKTFELFQKGQTKGIFQFESPGMQKYLKELKPNRFDELIAMNALYRPGPIAYIPSFIKRKHGQEPITFDLSIMSEYLTDTYGITVYQEQVMLLSQSIAGFSKGDADKLRKAMGKKDRQVLDGMKSKFIEGASSKGHDSKILEKIWTDWEAFASYAFNKSHSTCYAYIAYQTAFLKANYTPEFLAANLTHNMSKTDQVAFYLDECKELKIDVLGPDVNESFFNFSVNKNGQIRVGLGALKGVGENAVMALIEGRKDSNYTSFFDITRRANLRTVNKRVFESLAMAGGFDEFKGVHRAQYFYTEPNEQINTIEKALRYGQSHQENENSSQVSLFGEESGVEMPEPKIQECEPWTDLEKLKNEKDIIGIYVSGHPLDSYKIEIEKFCNKKVSDIVNKEALKGREIAIAGMITTAQHKTAKNGNLFGSFRIEDYDGNEEIVLFGDDYLKFRTYIQQGLFVFIKGKIDVAWRDGPLKFIIQQIQLLSDVRNKMTKDFTIQLSNTELTEGRVDTLLYVINKHKGDIPLKIEIYDSVEKITFDMFAKRLRINPTNEFLRDLLEHQFHNFEFNKGPEKNMLIKAESNSVIKIVPELSFEEGGLDELLAVED